jgi:hypothetical protein
MKIKPGYKTSEFWFTLVSFLFSGLYLVGIIGDPSQKEELIRDVTHGVESIILIGGQCLILYRYIKGRDDIKKTAIIEEEKQNTTTLPKEIEKPNKPATTKKTVNKKKAPAAKEKKRANSKRTSKNRS